MFRVGVFAVDPETEKWASLHDTKQKHLPEESRPKYGLEYPQARHTNPCQVERAVFASFPAPLPCSTTHRRVHHVSRASRKSPPLDGSGWPGGRPPLSDMRRCSCHRYSTHHLDSRAAPPRHIDVLRVAQKPCIKIHIWRGRKQISRFGRPP